MDYNKLLSIINKDEPSSELFDQIKYYVNELIKDSLENSVLWQELYKDNSIVYDTIKSFLLGNGKRLRPIIFMLLYLSYTKKPNWKNSAKTMLSMELIHAFILIHDDIVDKSDFRRSLPTLHKSFNNSIQNINSSNTASITGEDMALVAGDMIYAMAINTFIEVDIPSNNFLKALKNLTKTAMFTAHGEIKEMLETLKPLDGIFENDLYNIYDLKTAYYTFCSPAILGAILADKMQDTNLLEKIGLSFGRAFQILNDLIELEEFSKYFESKPPKDLKEKKRTLIIYWAYKTSKTKDKKQLENFINTDKDCNINYKEIYKIISNSGAIDYAKKEIIKYKNEAKSLIAQLSINEKSAKILSAYFDIIVPDQL